MLKHGTLSIGFIGLAETLTALYGHHHGESEEMQQKGLAIVKPHARFLRRKKSQAMKMNFTLLATPGRGALRALYPHGPQSGSAPFPA